MSEDLDNEVAVICSIFGEETLQKADVAGVYILLITQADAALRLSFPPDYPEISPQIIGTQRVGKDKRKGYGNKVLDIARETLKAVFIPGSVCLFDLLQELEVSFTCEEERQSPPLRDCEKETERVQQASQPYMALDAEPKWTLSAPVAEKESTFLARACSVKSPVHANACIAHLLDTDKRVAKATHNITAYRLHSPAAVGSASANIFQDYDDDGETAAGGRLLHLLQIMDVWGVLVVVSRWYGGVKLGPDRFSIINNVARQAVIEGGWTKHR